MFLVVDIVPPIYDSPHGSGKPLHLASDLTLCDGVTSIDVVAMHDDPESPAENWEDRPEEGLVAFSCCIDQGPDDDKGRVDEHIEQEVNPEVSLRLDSLYRLLTTVLIGRDFFFDGLGSGLDGNVC